VTAPGLVLREASPEDDAAIAAITAASPDGGAVQYRTRDHVPPRLLVPRDSVAVVAELPGVGPVGAARVSLGRCAFAGELRRYALLGSLVVHPAHRRQGVGAALARWRIAYAEEHAGEDVLVLANIQSGNAASLANAARWSTGLSRPALVAPVPVATREPVVPEGWRMGEAEPGDLEEFAAGLAAFTAGHDLARPWTADSLAAWLADSPLPEPVNHLLVARDTAGRMLAGLALREAGRLRSMEIVRVPPAIRAVDRLLHLLPRDGVLRPLDVDRFWFDEGRPDAARRLWEHARWAWRDRGSVLLTTIDARSPLRLSLGLQPWSPTTTIHVAVRSPVPWDASAPFDPIL